LQHAHTEAIKARSVSKALLKKRPGISSKGRIELTIVFMVNPALILFYTMSTEKASRLIDDLNGNQGLFQSVAGRPLKRIEEGEVVYGKLKMTVPNRTNVAMMLFDSPWR
jgi:hypothetical protein